MDPLRPVDRLVPGPPAPVPALERVPGRARRDAQRRERERRRPDRPPGPPRPADGGSGDGHVDTRA